MLKILQTWAQEQARLDPECQTNGCEFAADAGYAGGLVAQVFAPGGLVVKAAGGANKAALSAKTIDTLADAEKTRRAAQTSQPVFNSNNAFDTIDQFRKHKGGLDELGDAIPVEGDGQGTVAFVEINGKPVFGVNSSSLVRDADKNIGREWADRLGLRYGQGVGQFLTHAEAHSLMRAYQKSGGRIPENTTLFVDRVSCAICQAHLPKLVDAMGIKKINLKFKNG